MERSAAGGGASGPGRWVAGIIHHASYDDLSRCLASVAQQTCAAAATVVVDTGTQLERLAALREAHPDASFELRENRGWGAGANRILARVELEQPGTEFVLLLNPDVELDEDFAEVVIGALDAHPRAALASGKLWRPGREKLDSAGIRLPRHRRPRDRGSGELGVRRYEAAECVFGVSGAAMMLRRAALADLAVAGEVVDEDFFAYQDDTDLCWRANLLGWEVFYEPRAQAVHSRRWRRERRSEIEPWVRRHSFKNHYLQIIKNERPVDFVLNLPWLLAWEALRLGFALLRDPAVLPAYREAWRAARPAFAKRSVIQARRRGVSHSTPAAVRQARGRVL